MAIQVGGGPADIVEGQISLANGYASQSFSATLSFLDSLANFTASVQPISAGALFEQVQTPDPTFNIPDTPPVPNIAPVTISIPNFTDPDIDAEFGDLPDAPEFTAQDPTLNLPVTPSPLNVPAPDSAPDIETDFEFPDAPTEAALALPDVPTFEELDIPEAPVVSIPEFLENLPDVDSIGAPPNSTFFWDEDFYTDALLEAASAELLSRITNGGTGLNIDVEQAIWDRARNREDKNSIRSMQELIKAQAARGFSRPSGSLLAGLDMLAQETQSKIADLSREIAIKQAELEQENFQNSLQQSVALEGQLLNYSNQVQQRSFDAERVTVELAIEVYKARVEQFGIELETYKAAAQVFETEIRAELAKIEIFKQQIEAQSLINDINDSRVRLYVARLEGVKTSVEVYKAQIDAVTSRIQAEGLKLENYKTEVEAYTAQVGAKRDEYGIYAEQVKAELSKVEVFEAQSRAFAARVQGYAAQVDVEAKKVDARVETAKANTAAYLARVDGLIKQAQANQLQVQSSIDIYRGQSDLFRALVGAESSRIDAESKVYDIAVREATANAEIAIKNAEIALANADNIAKLRLEAISSGATVGAQLSAASLSALNIGASISGNSSDNFNYNFEM